MKKIDFLLLVVFLDFKIFSEQFIYPTAYDEKSQIVYIVHQKSIYTVNLFLWNYQTLFLQKVFLFNFLPGGLKLIPNSDAFSFIDNGRLRIKSFIKRSSKTINFYEPISDIGIMNWINERVCYFSARKNSNFIILAADIKENTLKIIEQKDKDCIYPQKINNDLFYIERQISIKYNINKNSYKIIKKNYFDNKKPEEIILDNIDKPIAFLNMISEHSGFFLGHPINVNKEQELISFDMQYLKFENNKWTCIKLFSFNLPTKYIFGNNDERLYESMLPFLPKIHNSNIFFSNCNPDRPKSLSTNLYCYNLETKKIKQLTMCTEKDQIYFSPIKIQNKLFYGKKVIDEKICIENKVNENSFSLPSILL